MKQPSWLPPEIETDRLRLRPVSDQDVRAIFAYASDPEVSKWTLWEPHQNPEDTLEFIRGYVFPSYEERDPEPLAIELKSDPGVAIGTVGCFRQEGKASSHTMELAYALGKSHWGKGISVEASRALITWVLKSHPEIHRIQAHCKIENEASARVMEKLGMSFEGVLRDAAFHRGRHWDVKMYSVLRPEWRFS